MALGFGFNKTKVLAQAEKCVQQGKLPNAILEYEKIIKDDPKDLTVLNTVGDLYARVGDHERAAHYFKKVGDQYAQDGFTVKAIAIYKKLAKLSPGDYENISKLGDLYSQQGLFNDARVQYMQVADHLLRSGDNAQAARIFQRILELDPENTVTQTKLADLYLKLGKKAEARNIYYTAAEALYARGSYDAANEALTRILAMDPENAQAILLRGMIAADGGDSQAAAKYLAQVPDLDSRPDGLRALLRAMLESGSLDGAEGVATKLLTVHNDPSGVSALADWYVANNGIGSALKLYDRFADRFLAGDRAQFQATLYPLIGKIKDNPEALNTMTRLMQRASDNTHSAELMELQAHAFAQKGELRQARDLYLKLSELEPENSLHAQSYRQIQARLGEDSATRMLSPEEAAQAFMVEELDEGTAVHQNYDPPTEQAIDAALTDAELFVSYNVPAKAIPPLEAVLPMAPRDVALNQRLAVLYARSERYADAARVCGVLSDVYRELGHDKDAARYLEASRRYALRAPMPPPPATSRIPVSQPAVAPPPVMPLAPVAAMPVEAPMAPLGNHQGHVHEFPTDEASSVREFTFDVPDHLMTEAATALMPPAPASATVHTPHAGSGDAMEQETDLSNEWEDMLSVEGEEGHAAPAVEIRSAAPVERAPVESVLAGRAASEKIEEIRFYISQHMWDMAKKAILDLTEIAPDAPEVTELIAAVSAGQVKAAASAPPDRSAAALISEFEAKPPAPPAIADPVALVEDSSAAADTEDAAGEFQFESQAPEPVEIISEPPPPPPPSKPAEVAASAKPVSARPAPAFAPQDVAPEPPRRVAPPAVPSPVAPVAAPASAPAAQMAPTPAAKVTPVAPHAPELEGGPLDDILDIPIAKPSAKSRATSASKSTEDILSDFVHDMEKTELVDFVPRAKPEPVSAQPALAGLASVSPAPKATPQAPARAARKNGDMQDAESSSVLNDILAELQEEGDDGLEPQEDPETHYNLGIAFKEMGLLDEAIGELQKVCHAVDRGTDFSQPIQAYTWLAQCLVDKGVPEAAVRWYQRALHLPSLDDGSRCAIYYDLAQAYEASGDKKSALANFMEVYGSNIDFRDVASRIKVLKS